MPKDRRDRSVSFDRSQASPYRCSSSRSRKPPPKNYVENEENVKEWEDARCPVCMEHPHNAILLLCSSHDKGCRPYMCDTSYRHSNCFDQFRKSFSETMPGQEETPVSTMNIVSEVNISSSDFQVGRSEEGSASLTSCENQEKSKLVCPLCRGQINGWMVVKPARIFMNSKSRSCASETCDFSGTYMDLRKHARSVHPLVRPSEADPERQRDWRRMERQRDFGDLISTLRSSLGEGRGEDNDAALSIDEGGWLTVFLLIRVFRPGNSLRISSSSDTSRTSARVTVRRTSTTRFWGESYDGESRDDDNNESSDGGSASHRVFRRVRRRPNPETDA